MDLGADTAVFESPCF